LVTALGIALRFAEDAVCLGLFGVAAFGLYNRAALALLRARRLIIIGSALGLAAGLLSIAVMDAQMTGEAGAALRPSVAIAMLTSMPGGWAIMVRMAALVLCLGSALAREERRATLPAAIAAVSLAWNGHAASGEGWMGDLRLAADAIHQLAAGIWLGALAAFLQLAWLEDAGDAPELEAGLTRFAGVGSGVVAVLAATGLVNLGETAGWDRLWRTGETLWGQLLLIKLAVFAAMLGLAALNRFRLTPGLLRASQADRVASLRRLRVSLALENGLALTVIALVAWLGTLDPHP
jgi:putative copper resistance protein D